MKNISLKWWHAAYFSSWSFMLLLLICATNTRRTFVLFCAPPDHDVCRMYKWQHLHRYRKWFIYYSLFLRTSEEPLFSPSADKLSLLVENAAKPWCLKSSPWQNSKDSSGLFVFTEEGCDLMSGTTSTRPTESFTRWPYTGISEKSSFHGRKRGSWV